MPRAVRPPASPRRSYWRAKARREAIALAIEARAESRRMEQVKRQLARQARFAREEAGRELERRYYEAMARPPAPVTPVRDTILDRAEAKERAAWKALGIEV